MYVYFLAHAIVSVDWRERIQWRRLRAASSARRTSAKVFLHSSDDAASVVRPTNIRQMMFVDLTTDAASTPAAL